MIGYFNFWGFGGHGKSTIFKKVLEALGEDAYPLRKDTTRRARRGEKDNPEYRQIPHSLLKRRANEGHYRYPVEGVWEDGKIEYHGVPLPPFFPEIPTSTQWVLSVFPADRQITWLYRPVDIFIFVSSVKIFEERLREKHLNDTEGFRQKLALDAAFRNGSLLLDPGVPNLHRPPYQYPHIIDNNRTIEESLIQVAQIIPGLAEKL